MALSCVLQHARRRERAQAQALGEVSKTPQKLSHRHISSVYVACIHRGRARAAKLMAPYGLREVQFCTVHAVQCSLRHTEHTQVPAASRTAAPRGNSGGTAWRLPAARAFPIRFQSSAIEAPVAP